MGPEGLEKQWAMPGWVKKSNLLERPTVFSHKPEENGWSYPHPNLDLLKTPGKKESKNGGLLYNSGKIKNHLKETQANETN